MKKAKCYLLIICRTVLDIYIFGVSWSQNYGVSINAFGASMGEHGYGFNPSLGFSYGMSFESNKNEIPVNAYVSNNPEYFYNLPSPEIIGFRNAHQRFLHFYKNFYNWRTSPPTIPSPFEGYGINVNFEISAGAQIGGAISIGGVGSLSADIRPVTMKLIDFNYSPSSGITHDHFLKNGLVNFGSEITTPVISMYQGWDVDFSGNSSNYISGVTLPGWVESNSYTYYPLFEASVSNFIGLRLSIDLRKPR